MAIIELSHPITDGMLTYPGLPAPAMRTILSREESERSYGDGVTFHVGVVEICTNTGTYMDVPYHRYADGHDLASLDLSRVVDVPLLVVDGRGARTIDLTGEDLVDATGHAVLVRTGHDRRFGTQQYAENAPFLTASSADALVAADVAVVGIDSVNIDDMQDTSRPVHSALLAAGIPIVEHLRDLDQPPARGARFTAVPPPLVDVGTFTVRAFAQVRS